MNKNDKILIIVLIVIVSVLSLIFYLKKEDGKTAIVYYENEIIKRIDLSLNKTYTVEGYNGKVVIEVLDYKIRVIEETSPYHLCSKQGFISNSNQTLVCLPNKIVIEISGDELDTEVG